MDIGKAVGGVLVVGAAAAVWLWPKGEPASPPCEPVRPVRSVVVESGLRMPDLRFSGTVKANESRTLMFKQSGRVARIPVSKGQRMSRGERLAELDSLDFRNRLAQAEAALERDRLTHARKADAAKKNAVSQEELSQAAAQLRQSEAAYELARRALEETVLVAPFDCTVADIPASELDMVGPSTPVVKIQDLSKVKVDVVYPEAAVIVAKKLRSEGTNGCCGVEIAFDSFPARRYPAKFVEYTGTADEKTQTYLATYEMTPPDDLNLLPGMSATLYVSGGSYRYDDGGEPGVVIPESAVGVDSQGGHFVWKLTPVPDADGRFRATRAPVVLGHAVTAGVTVEKGVAAGDRLATAGVAVISENRVYRLLGE